MGFIAESGDWLEVSRTQFIYICGADGTGKSTQAQLLIDYYRKQSTRCKHLWLRFPFFLSLPFLFYARWRGNSWHEVTNGVDHGYWDFQRPWLMRFVFPYCLFIDAAVASIFKIYLPLRLGYTIVCERFVIDMMVDLTISTGDIPYHTDKFDRFLKLIPREAVIIGLAAPISVVTKRRPDLKYDRNLGDRLSVYETLITRFGYTIIETTDRVEETHQLILKLIQEIPIY